MKVASNKFSIYFHIIIVTLFQLSTGRKVGVCNVCLAMNNVACLDENHFTICSKALPTGIITPCPPSSVCTNDRQICRSIDDDFTPICYEEHCGNCQASNGVFTCMDQTSFAYCSDSSTPNTEAISSCHEGFVCNIYSSEICVPAATNQPTCLTKPSVTTTTEEPTTTEPTTTEPTTTEPTTTEPTTTEPTTIESTTTEPSTTEPTTTEPTTTEPPTTEPTTTELTTTEPTTTEPSTTEPTTSEPTTTEPTTAECATEETVPTSTTTDNSVITPTPPGASSTESPRDANTICGEIGKIGYFKSDDPTCREYIYCYPLSGQYLGWSYFCDGYFNAETQKCQLERPSDCEEQ